MMEEVQSWWEVPAVAHFCYVFRSAFNLIFFEIAELESALLNIQDPDMSISLEQLLMRLLQGFENEVVVEESWEETLHELFDENLEDNENPLDKFLNFQQLTPRKKMEVLYKLCELRLEVKDAIDAIKDIASEDMKATCLGKDGQNNSYWYFYEERLYKESSSSIKKTIQKDKSIKIAKKQTVNVRERKKADLDNTWNIACFNISDWEKLIKTFSKSKNSSEKELVSNMKEQLPVIQENVNEKFRLLRKRYVELAPKRSSSRITKVQEKKKMEKLKAHEEAEKARIQAEKEQAKRAIKKKKLEILERQRRAEERHKAIQKRAELAKLREKVSDIDSDEEVQTRQSSRKLSNKQWQNDEEQSDEQSTTEKEEMNSDYENESTSSDSQQKSVRNYKYKQNKIQQSYSNQNKRVTRRTVDCQEKASPRLKRTVKRVKYNNMFYDSDEQESERDDDMKKTYETRVSSRTQESVKVQSIKNNISSDSSDTVECSNTNPIGAYKNIKQVIKHNALTFPITYCNESHNITRNSPRIPIYKSAVLQNSSDVSRWNSTLDSKGQKLHILHDSYDNLSTKKVKLQQVKSSRTLPPTLKSSISKENQGYQPFHHESIITYSKMSSSPAIVRLDLKKSSSNHG